VASGSVSSSVIFDCLSPAIQPPCYAPALFRAAYGIQSLLDGGLDGRGETVTVVSPAPSSSGSDGQSAASGQPPSGTDIRKDLEAFDREFRLPAPRVEVVTSLAGAASPWQASDEEVGDFEIIHLVAPAAVLRVVLLPSNVLANAENATADMLAALPLAVSGTDVASISWSLGEHFFTKAQVARLHSILLGAEARHVTVLGSSGDHDALSDTRFGSSPVKEVSLPASDPLVLGVGGTTLSMNPLTGAYISETAWNPGAGGSGGGFSHLYARPAYQDGVPGTGATRGVPDVSAEADAGWPVVLNSGGQTWITAGSGTSASCPLWAGVITLADQYAHHDLGFVNPAIYALGRGARYHEAFHDVTTGDNTISYGSGTFAGYQAAAGWDPVTGWGSPDAQVLVPLLAAAVG
jgi:subtilase family serine protease